MHILLWSVPLVFWCQSYISIAQKEEQDLHFQFLFDFLTWEPEILDCDISFVWKSDFFQDVVIALKTMELKENINRGVYSINIDEAYTLQQGKHCILFFIQINLPQSINFIQNTLQSGRYYRRNFFIFVFQSQAEVEGLLKRAHDLERVVSFYQVQNKMLMYNIDRNCYKNRVQLLNLWCSEHGFYKEDKLFQSSLFPSGCEKEIVVTAPDGCFPFYEIAQNHRSIPLGSDLLLIDYLTKGLDLKYRVVPYIDGKWGNMVNKTTLKFNGMIGMVQRKEADVAIGCITITYERNMVVDFTLPYLMESIALTTCKPRPIPQWRALFLPFTNSIWVILILSIFFFTSIHWLFTVQIQHDPGFTLNQCFFNTYKSFFNQAIHSWPKDYSSKILFIFWCLFVLLITAAYSSQLISSLTSPTLSKALNSVEEIAEQNDLNVVFTNGTIHEVILRDSKEKAFKKLWKKIQSQDPSETFTNSLDELFADMYPNCSSVIVMDYTPSHAASMINYMSLTGKSYLYQLKEVFFNMGYGFALQKDSDLTHSFNHFIRKSLYYGLNMKWIQDTIFKMRLLNNQKVKTNLELENQKNIKINLMHLQGAFFALILGFILSIPIFMTEKLLMRQPRK